MNDSNGRKHKREELRLFCCYKVLALIVKKYNVI